MSNEDVISEYQKLTDISVKDYNEYVEKYNSELGHLNSKLLDEAKKRVIGHKPNGMPILDANAMDFKPELPMNAIGYRTVFKVVIDDPSNIHVHSKDENGKEWISSHHDTKDHLRERDNMSHEEFVKSVYDTFSYPKIYEINI